jgi:hypothetical protein
VEIRPFEIFDYQMLCQWYSGWRQKTPPLVALPSTGLIAFKGETPVACVFLYRTDSAIAIIECLVSNPLIPPDTAKELRREAFDALWEEVKVEISRTGHSIIMALPTHPNVKKFLEAKGLREDTTPYSFMIGRA